MGEVAEETSTTLVRIQSSLDLLHGVIANIDTEQKQLRVQIELQAAVIEDSASKHGDTTRILAVLTEKLQILECGIPTTQPGMAAVPDLQIRAPTQPTPSPWAGTTAGASSGTAPRVNGVAIDPGGDGLLGGGGHGGAGGGG
jgi:hypothetical protein